MKESLGIINNSIKKKLFLLHLILFSSVLLPNFSLILNSLASLSNSNSNTTMLSTSNGHSNSNSNSTVSLEPVLKRKRINPKFSNNENEDGLESSSVLSSGFIDSISSRYIVPSYTETSLSLIGSHSYIQMIQQHNKLNSNQEFHQNLQGRGLCEYTLMNILGN